MRPGALSTALVVFMLLSPGADAADAPQRPRCFGAEARDPLQPCRNQRLRLSVVPRPADAGRYLGAPCPTTEVIVDKPVCSFGVPARRARRFVALVGDSHASGWRPAVTHVADELDWSGVRITHASCPLSKALRDLPEPNRAHCARWKRAVFKWFERHPEVDTLIVSQLSGGSGVVPSRGRGAFETAVAGYQAAWRALPTIKHVLVIRDTPKAKGSTPACVERAMARRVPAGAACAIPRRAALDADPAVAAARRTGGPRVHVVDLTDVFCGPRTCLPVVGGALVHRDTTHLTATFVESLGGPLLRRIAALAQSWPQSEVARAP